MNAKADTEPMVYLDEMLRASAVRTPKGRRVLWRAKWIIVAHWLGRQTDPKLLQWAQFIVEANR